MIALRGVGRWSVAAALVAAATAPAIANPAEALETVTYPEVVVNDGASVFWRLGDTSGSTATDYLVGNDATYLGGPTLGAASIVNDPNPSVDFDGVNDSIHLTNSTDINQGDPITARSVELWFEGSDVSTRQTLYEQGSVKRGLNIYIEAGSLHAGIYNMDNFGGGAIWGPLFISAPVAPNTANHVVMTFDQGADEFILYLNGVQVAQTGGVGALYPHGRSAIGAQWHWARYLDGADEGDVNHFDGRIDEVALYPFALSPTAVANHYTVGTTGGSDLPLVSIVAPTAGSTVSATTTVAVNATDNDPAGSLLVEVNPAGAGWVTAAWNAATSRYEYAWDTTASADGATTVAARATDSDTNVVTDSINVVVSNAPPGNYRDAVVADGAGVLWRLGELSGTTAVDDLVGNDATYLGSPTLGAPALIADSDRAVFFDGTNDNIHLANSTDINQGGPFSTRSVELWFNAGQVSSRQTLYEQGSISRGLSIYVENSTLYAGIYNTDTYGGGTPWGPVFLSAPVAAGVTNHVVITFDVPGDEFALYRNGVVVDSSGGIGLLYAHGRSAIGAQWDWARYHDGADQGNTNYFGGTIDEVALYPLALSASAVASHYIAGTNSGPISPSVFIESPGNNAVVAGIRTIVINATDDDPVGSLDVDVNTGSGWTSANWDSGSGRYKFVWNTASQPDGPATIQARATDNDGNTATTSIAVTINNSPPSNSIRQQKCLQRANSAQSDPQLTAAQKQWLYDMCAGDLSAEAVAEPQGVMAPELFPDHLSLMKFPNEVGDRFGHALHCMDITANRFGLVHRTGGGVDPLALGGSAPLNHTGEFLLAEVGGEVKLFTRMVIWDVRPDNQPMTIKHQVLHPSTGNPNVTVARIYNPPQFEPVSLWTEIESTILTAYFADMDSETIDFILPGRIMNFRSWYDDSYCHDKRAETRIPTMLLDYVASMGFGSGTAGLDEPIRIRFNSTGDPYVPSNWSLETTNVTVRNPQTTNGYRWFWAADVNE